MEKIFNTHKRNGFTLIEIMIVFTLIGILVGMSIPNFSYTIKRSREVVLKKNLWQMRYLINQYYTDKGKYPLSIQSLVDEEYLRSIPIDPITKSSKTWIEVQETPTEEDVMSLEWEPGIMDVFSGSDMKALDGTLYKTW